MAGHDLSAPIVGMAATGDGRGYWLVGSDGGVFSFGDARFMGSMAGHDLSAPIVGMAATGDGGGYWLVGSDGGVFSFGDARFMGSTGDLRLSRPVVGMAALGDGRGYWLVASDGGVFSFGDARFMGSTGDLRLSRPVVGMAALGDGRGYWLVASDGGVFTFGASRFLGSAAGSALVQPVVGIAANAGGTGYWLAQGQGGELPLSLFDAPLTEALGARAGIVSAAVLDLHTGLEYLYRPGQGGFTASIVKVEILATLLRDAQAARRTLTPLEQSLAGAMIEHSDNDAATALWDEVGGAPGVSSFGDAAGMRATVPSAAWGLTVTTAADQVTLLSLLAGDNEVLSPASRSYEVDLMSHVEPDQAWGVSAGVAPGTSVALKNGWLPLGDTWTVNSVGWVRGSGRDYLIAVLTDGDPNEAYGIDSISEVSEAAWNALAG